MGLWVFACSNLVNEVLLCVLRACVVVVEKGEANLSYQIWDIIQSMHISLELGHDAYRY